MIIYKLFMFPLDSPIGRLTLSERQTLKLWCLSEPGKPLLTLTRMDSMISTRTSV